MTGAAVLWLRRRDAASKIADLEQQLVVLETKLVQRDTEIHVLRQQAAHRNHGAEVRAVGSLRRHAGSIRLDADHLDTHPRPFGTGELNGPQRRMVANVLDLVADDTERSLTDE